MTHKRIKTSLFYAVIQKVTDVESVGWRIDEVRIKGWIPTYTIEGDSSTWITSSKDTLIATPEAAAIIAKAAVISIYDEECAKEQPYKIVSNSIYWIVSGTLRDGYVGGTFTMVIRKKDGKIEHYYHEK